MKLQTARNIILLAHSFTTNAYTSTIISEAVGDGVSRYTNVPQLNNWDGVASFCAERLLLLPTLAQICPNGSKKPPVGGSIVSKVGDQFVAIANESWVQVDTSNVCVTHPPNPSWGKDDKKSNWESNYVYCFGAPEPTSEPTSDPTSDPTSQPTLSPTTFIEGIEGIAKGGCKTRIDFSSAFFASDSGAACDTCALCDESTTNSLFNPHIENVCMDCSKADDACNTLQVVTKFDSSWLMNVLSLTSSGMGIGTDPGKVIMKGSNDLKTWVELYNSQLVFAERKKPEEFPFINNKMYQYYSLGFERKKSSSKMHVGHFGLVEEYTKSCSIQLFEGISGNLITV